MLLISLATISTSQMTLEVLWLHWEGQRLAMLSDSNWAKVGSKQGFHSGSAGECALLPSQRPRWGWYEARLPPDGAVRTWVKNKFSARRVHKPDNFNFRENIELLQKFSGINLVHGCYKQSINTKNNYFLEILCSFIVTKVREGSAFREVLLLA